MKPMKLTSLMVMLLVGFSAAAQEEFFDDVYFSSKNKKKTAIKKGDKVQFKGGPVYISSDASRPTVTRGKAKCNCTIVNSNKHPYHLIHYSGAMVYGWVNASDCEKI